MYFGTLVKLPTVVIYHNKRVNAPAVNTKDCMHHHRRQLCLIPGHGVINLRHMRATRPYSGIVDSHGVADCAYSRINAYGFQVAVLLLFDHDEINLHSFTVLLHSLTVPLSTQKS